MEIITLCSLLLIPWIAFSALSAWVRRRPRGYEPDISEYEPDIKCRNCSNQLDGGFCYAKGGPVDPDDWCSYFEHHGKRPSSWAKQPTSGL